MPGGQTRVREVSWVLLVRVQDGKLLRRHPMPHPLHVQWKTVGALRRRIGSPWARRFLRFRSFLVPAAPWSADDRSGIGSALLRSFQPLLGRWRHLRAVGLLLHCWSHNRLGWRAGRCCCCFAIPLTKLLLLLHHLPDLLHLLLPLGDHLLLCHLLPLLNPLTPRASGINSKDTISLCKIKIHKTSHF